MKRLIILITIISLWAVVFDASARYKGDLNSDDRVDLADMVFLAKAIKNGNTDKSCDINNSGKVDDSDLRRLADMIIYGTPSEDEGLNVGIGGWDESGEDFGGSLKAPAVNTRSAVDTRLYIREPRFEHDDIYSIEFGVVDGGEMNPYAILISLWVPVDNLDSTNPVILSESVVSTHSIYGTPKLLLDENELATDKNIRFIIFSPDLQKMDIPDGRLGRIFYSASHSSHEDTGVFINSQIISGDDMSCIDLPYHDAGFYGYFDAAVDGLKDDDAPCDIYTYGGQLLKCGVPPSEIQNLKHGFYLIRKRGKTTKLLK